MKGDEKNRLVFFPIGGCGDEIDTLDGDLDGPAGVGDGESVVNMDMDIGRIESEDHGKKRESERGDSGRMGSGSDHTSRLAF